MVDEITPDALIVYARTPAFFRIVIIGHHPVKADWNRFAPTNTVNQRNRASTYAPSRTVTITSAPAIRRNIAWRNAALRAALATLPPAYRMIVLLREMEGLSTREVAKVSRMSEDNVKTRLHRARVMLRAALATQDTR